MITRIQVKNFRSLRYIDQRLGAFHVLVGPNACGKTTFLDTIAFVGSMLENGLDRAVEERANNFRDLVWQHQDGGFEIAIECAVPETISNRFAKPFSTFRYEIRIDLDGHDRPSILAEKAWLQLPRKTQQLEIRDLFPVDIMPPDTVMLSKNAGAQMVLSKAAKGNDNFYVEVRDSKKPNNKGWVPSFKLGPYKSALANLPEDEEMFPMATWFKDYLQRGMRNLMLDSLKLRKPSPVKYRSGISSDGANLPWIVYSLETNDKQRYDWWIEHVRTALPDIKRVTTVEVVEDRSRYLQIEYEGGLTVPAWLVSDGTLRMLALTVLAYINGFEGICLLEEPENGIHPRAVETVYQALSQVYGSQVLLATHSPVIMSAAKIADVLCFSKTKMGATDIVEGSLHPALRNWRGQVNLGELYAGGVL